MPADRKRAQYDATSSSQYSRTQSGYSTSYSRANVNTDWARSQYQHTGFQGARVCELHRPISS